MISILFGTRPEIIKLYPIIEIFKKKKIDFSIIHTGQHYNEKLSNQFIDQFKFPKNKLINLKVGSNSHGKQTSLMIERIEKYLKENKKIKCLIVYGDTNTALAGSIVASKMENIKLVHLEAGLRSFDKNMPEEINRRLIDHCSDLLLCPTDISKKYLINEGIDKNKIFVTGNTILDAIKSKLVKSKLNNEIKENNHLLLTIHREENTKNFVNLKIILAECLKIAKKNNLKIFFPIHPKTKKILKNIKYNKKTLILKDPLNYIEFLRLMKSSKIIISDSGGVQEEACILKVPLVTVRNSTERPETLSIGCNILSKITNKKIYRDANILLKRKINWKNPYGNGTAAIKSYKEIIKLIKKNEPKNY